VRNAFASRWEGHWVKAVCPSGWAVRTIPVMAALDADQPLVISSLSLGAEVPFAERVALAAEAGFAGIGLSAKNYWDALASGLTDSDMSEILDRHGVQVQEVEYLFEWATRVEGEVPQAMEATIFHVARTFGVGHVNAGLFGRSRTTRSWPGSRRCASGPAS
jgi:sugar phosphate isomerase/epimerase